MRSNLGGGRYQHRDIVERRTRPAAVKAEIKECTIYLS